MRSRWMRSVITASAPRIASSTVGATLEPSDSTPAGMRVAGPASVTSTPRAASPKQAERATRECPMSPTIATRRPSKPPCQAWRSVMRSSRPWVGCSWRPSPALMTPVSRWRAR